MTHAELEEMLTLLMPVISAGDSGPVTRRVATRIWNELRGRELLGS